MKSFARKFPSYNDIQICKKILRMLNEYYTTLFKKRYNLTTSNTNVSWKKKFLIALPIIISCQKNIGCNSSIESEAKSKTESQRTTKSLKKRIRGPEEAKQRDL